MAVVHQSSPQRDCEEGLPHYYASLLKIALQAVQFGRKLLADMDEIEAMNFIVDKLKSTKNNAEFFDLMRRGG